jgi:hypothetical protein
MRRGYSRPSPQDFDPGTSGYASAPRLSSMLSRRQATPENQCSRGHVEKLLPTGYRTGIGFGKGKRSRPDDHQGYQGYQGVEAVINHDAVHDAFMMPSCHTNSRVVDISSDEAQC